MRNTVAQPRVLAKIPSKSNPLKSYEIRLGGDGVVYCTCIQWQMNKNCKHLEEYHTKNQQAYSNIPMTATEVAMRQRTAIPEFFKAQANQGTGDANTDRIYLTIVNGIMRGVWE